MNEPLYVHTGGVKSLSDIHQQVASAMPGLRDSPDAASLQTAYRTISSAFTSALGEALPSRDGTLIENTKGDHQAVTNFLTGANDPNSPAAQRMSVATLNGFTGDEGFRDLATHRFDDDQQGVKHMFDWIGNNARTPGLAGFDAAASANATGHLLGNKHEFFTRLPDGHGGYQTLGQVNPGLVQTFTGNMSPFIGSLDGVHTAGINAEAIPGFTDTREMPNMFEVLDTDPASAEALNRVVASWEQHFAYEFGETGNSELGRHAGQLTQAMTNANHSALKAMKTNQDWDGIRAYSNQEAHWDTAKETLGSVASLVPGGDIAFQVASMGEPYMKSDILGIPGDPGNMSAADWETALQTTDANFNHLVDGRLRDFNMAQGYVHGQGADLSPFQNVEVPGGTVDFVDTNGNLDWKTISQHTNEFNHASDYYSHLGGAIKDPLRDYDQAYRDVIK